MDTINEIREFLEELEIHLAMIIAGGFGSLLYISNTNELNGWQKLLTVISGGAVANYVTPVVTSLINIGDSSIYGFAFLLGFSGVEGVRWLILLLKSKYKVNK